MRPPEFTGGNPRRLPRAWPPSPRFNEAAGIHRRKRVTIIDVACDGLLLQ